MTDLKPLVEILKPIYGGAFLARIDGKAVFVPLTLPGEQARVRITEDKRSFANAEVEEIVIAALQRVTPACPYFGACGGCNYQHANYEAQLAFKQAILRETLERAGVKAPEEIFVLSANPWAYRNRIRLAFDANGNPGYRGRQSHSIVPIGECPIAAPILVRTAMEAASLLRELNWPVRPTEISLFCNSDESALLLSVFIRTASKGGFEEWMHALAKRSNALVGAELIAQQPSGKSLRTVGEWGWGAASIVYRAAGFDYRVDRGAFFQVNRWLVDALVDRVTNGRAGRLAWDLFAGVGLFARKLADSFDRVIAVESAPAAMSALEHNLQGTTGAAVKAETLAFLRRHARSGNKAAGQSSVPDLIVVDPPRTGLGTEITTFLNEIAAAELVYVSCDPATLARDLHALTSIYTIESLTLADLFPQTFHLETVVQLRRS
jgi:23S rRNA (uracil1939-C5)-methyltransferase